MVMVGLRLRISFWVLCVITLILKSSTMSCNSWCPIPSTRKSNVKFQQKATRFSVFEEKTKSWVEISLPFDLMSCVNGNCTKVGTIENRIEEAQKEDMKKDRDDKVVDEKYVAALPLRKRISLTRMSEASLWVTGQSGSIYERFWNGVEWVIAPHELPTSAGPAVSIFIVNQTILSLSELGMLYQIQLNENSQPIWTEFILSSDSNIHTAESEPTLLQIKSGLVSHDGERLYLSTANKYLLEISEVRPLRWENHGRPQGGDVLAIVDTGSIKPGVVFTVR